LFVGGIERDGVCRSCACIALAGASEGGDRMKIRFGDGWDTMTILEYEYEYTSTRTRVRYTRGNFLKLQTSGCIAQKVRKQARSKSAADPHICPRTHLLIPTCTCLDWILIEDGHLRRRVPAGNKGDLLHGIRTMNDRDGFVIVVEEEGIVVIAHG
jgi:hypothetical protein